MRHTEDQLDLAGENVEGRRTSEPDPNFTFEKTFFIVRKVQVKVRLTL
jgi:hypothetical protein